MIKLKSKEESQRIEKQDAYYQVDLALSFPNLLDLDGPG
jgi:hypothetical protein